MPLPDIHIDVARSLHDLGEPADAQESLRQEGHRAQQVVKGLEVSSRPCLVDVTVILRPGGV